MSEISFRPELPMPSFFDPGRVGVVWRVPYGERAEDASRWAAGHQLRPAAEDQFRICLLGIDIQNTFCIPGFELYVGGRSGLGAVDDNRRLAEFIYRNLANITEIAVTQDTHQVMQIFHPFFLVDQQDHHPAPMTVVTMEEVIQGKWRFNPAAAASLRIRPEDGQAHLLHYTRQLSSHGKYALTIWPYHALQGGIGHALVSAVEEAIFFHTIARSSQADFIVKGNSPLTENYSAIGPEVQQDARGAMIGTRSRRVFEKLMSFDALVIAGQAKSHCVAWTVADLLDMIQQHDPRLAQKVYLLEDCASPVVVPGVVDFTETGDQAYQQFAEAGMHIVRSTTPIESWF